MLQVEAYVAALPPSLFSYSGANELMDLLSRMACIGPELDAISKL